MPSEIDYARLAAFLDGEGTITINRVEPSRPSQLNPQFRVDVMVVNTDPRLMTWLQRCFGGNIGRGGRHGTYYKCFKWRIDCKQAHDLLLHCLPYFVIKREQAELAIAFRETITAGGRKLSPDTLKKRTQLKLAIQKCRTTHLQKSVIPNPPA